MISECLRQFVSCLARYLSTSVGGGGVEQGSAGLCAANLSFVTAMVLLLSLLYMRPLNKAVKSSVIGKSVIACNAFTWVNQERRIVLNTNFYQFPKAKLTYNICRWCNSSIMKYYIFDEYIVTRARRWTRCPCVRHGNGNVTQHVTAIDQSRCLQSELSGPGCQLQEEL